MADIRKHYRIYVSLGFALMVLTTAVLMGYPPIQPLLEAGHIVSEYNWLLVFTEELLIALTQATLYCAGLMLFWVVVGVAAEYDRLFFKIIELYWVQFVAFLLFVVVVYLKLGHLKYLVALVLNIVPLVQSIFIYKSVFYSSAKNTVSPAIFVLTSFVLLVMLQHLYMSIYDNIVGAYR